MSYRLVKWNAPAINANCKRRLSKVAMPAPSKPISGNAYEITYEVRVEKPDAFLSRVQAVNGVASATLVAYQNETT